MSKTLGQVAFDDFHAPFRNNPATWERLGEPAKGWWESAALAVVAAHEAARWTRVEDGLPEGHGFYIVERDGMAFPYFAYWDGKHWLKRRSEVIYHDVTHWQPIPPPPDECECGARKKCKCQSCHDNPCHYGMGPQMQLRS